MNKKNFFILSLLTLPFIHSENVLASKPSKVFVFLKRAAQGTGLVAGGCVTAIGVRGYQLQNLPEEGRHHPIGNPFVYAAFELEEVATQQYKRLAAAVTTGAEKIKETSTHILEKTNIITMPAPKTTDDSKTLEISAPDPDTEKSAILTTEATSTEKKDLDNECPHS
jgi:hypothetical protein